MESVLKKDIKIKYSDMDCNLVLKPSVLLQLLQDMASEHADGLDFGYNFVRSKNLAWYLLKYRMEFNNYPENMFDIAIETKPRGYNKLFAFRDFKISNNNITVANVASTWALVDLTTKEIAPPPEVLKDCKYMIPYQKIDTDLKYSKIHLPENFDSEKTFEVRFEDLDVNKHVNNANYIIWAFETLNYNFRITHKLQALDIVFKKEIAYGNTVLSKVQLNNDFSVHVISNCETGEELCHILACWAVK